MRGFRYQFPFKVVPIYCVDPRHFGVSQYGPRKCGVIRARFLQESIAELQRNLHSIGSDLFVYNGEPESILPSLMKGNDTITIILAQEEVTYEEMCVDKAVRNAVKNYGGQLELIWGATMYHRSDLPFKSDLSDMPDVFTPFKDICER